MGELRTQKIIDAYNDFKAQGGLERDCPLCRSPIVKEFEYWIIMENIFPYDLIAIKHDMIITKRHVDEENISPEEWKEYEKIKKEYLHNNYEYIIEATYQKKSIPKHFHLHLVNAKN